MKDLFSPNRNAVLTGLLGALAAAAAGVLGAIDTVPKALVVSVCVIVAGAVLVVYLLGSQKDEARKFDALTPGQANTLAVAAVPDAVLPTPDPASTGAIAVTGARSRLTADEEAEARAELARRLQAEAAPDDAYFVEDPPEDAA
jgi:hypothetical protein